MQINPEKQCFPILSKERKKTPEYFTSWTDSNTRNTQVFLLVLLEDVAVDHHQLIQGTAEEP